MATLQVSKTDVDTELVWQLSEDRIAGETDKDFFARFKALAASLGFIEPEMRRFQIDVVVKREKTNEDGSTTTALDLYPTWNRECTYGQYKGFTHFLNSDHDRDLFEQATGLDVEKIKLYNGDSYTRKFKSPPKDFEAKPSQECFVVLRPRGEKEMPDGRMITQYSLVGYESE